MIKKKPTYNRKVPKYPNGGVITGYDDAGNPIYDSPNPTAIAQPKVGGSSASNVNTIGAATDLVSGALDSFKKPGTANVGLGTATGALTGVKYGAMIGSAVPVVGTAVGAAAGAVIGAGAGLISGLSKKKKLDEQTQRYQAAQLQNNITRSNTELAAYPTTGVANAQYYAKGGIISRYYKKMAEGGFIDDGGTGAKRDTSATVTTDPLMASYFKTHKLKTMHLDSSGNPEPFDRLWGEQPSILDIRTLRQKLGNAASNEVPLPPPTMGTYLPTGNGGNMGVSQNQRSTPTPYIAPPSDHRFAHGGHIKKRRIGVGVPAPIYNSQIPDESMQLNTPQNYAGGGSIANPQYEVEQGEVVQGNPQLEESNQLASDMHQVGGQSHEQGGTNGIGGERVFSDRLKISPELAAILKESKISLTGNSTYADAATKLGRMKGKMEDKLTTNFQPSINTGKKTIDRIDEATEALFQDQEIQKAMTNKAPVRGYAMGGNIPKYYNGEDLIMPRNPALPSQSTNTQYDADFQPIDNRVQNVTLNNPLIPDVHPTFGQEVLDGVGNYVKSNSGDITNFANYLANIGSINQLDTTVKRSYLNPPTYNYVNRSGEAVAQNQRTFHTALKSMTGSSRGVNASNAGALYASTLENNSRIANAENLRRDAYNENYSQRGDRINEFNTVVGNQAADASRDLNNNKNVTLPLGARNAWLQGVMANQQIKSNQRADRVKMALALASNDQNGVMTRFMKNYNNGGKEKLKDLLKGYGFGDDN